MSILIDHFPAANDSVKEAVYSGLPGRANGPADAYRHLLWAAELTRRYGETAARAILNGHEITGSNTDREKSLDYHNNERAIEIGKGVAERGGDWGDVIEAARNEIDRSIKAPNIIGKDGFVADSKKVAWFPENEWSQNPKHDVTGLDISNDQSNWPPVFSRSHALRGNVNLNSLIMDEFYRC